MRNNLGRGGSFDGKHLQQGKWIAPAQAPAAVREPALDVLAESGDGLVAQSTDQRFAFFLALVYLPPPLQSIDTGAIEIRERDGEMAATIRGRQFGEGKISLNRA